MFEWLDLWSFIVGCIVGAGLSTAGIVIKLRVDAKRNGDTQKTIQKNIAAGGDVTGRDKVTKSSND